MEQLHNKRGAGGVAQCSLHSWVPMFRSPAHTRFMVTRASNPSPRKAEKGQPLGLTSEPT